MKKKFYWLYEKYLDWRLRKLYPNGVSEQEYQQAVWILRRKTIEENKEVSPKD